MKWTIILLANLHILKERLNQKSRNAVE